MEGYSYSHQNQSIYRTDEVNVPVTRRPFVPFVPNSNHEEEGYVTRKTVVPVATTTPYRDDYYPTKGYPMRDDDDYLQKKKVDDFLIQVRNEGSRSPALGSPIRNDNYYPNGIYGRGTPNDTYDRYRQPVDAYTSFEPHRTHADGWSRPNPGWTPPPRNGTQLSEPTGDIGKAMGLLKGAASVYGEYSNSNRGKPKNESYYGSDRPNPSIWADPPGNVSPHNHNREPTRVDKARELAKEAERLRSLKNKLLGEPTKQHKDDYYYRDTMGREDQRRYGDNMSSWQAQKKYGGASF